MTVCTFDNPKTMARECWQDKTLLCSYSANLMLQKGRWPPPRDNFFFGANIGDWIDGQMIGDKEAIGNG